MLLCRVVCASGARSRNTASAGRIWLRPPGHLQPILRSGGGACVSRFPFPIVEIDGRGPGGLVEVTTLPQERQERTRNAQERRSQLLGPRLRWRILGCRIGG